VVVGAVVVVANSSGVQEENEHPATCAVAVPVDRAIPRSEIARAVRKRRALIWNLPVLSICTHLLVLGRHWHPTNAGGDLRRCGYRLAVRRFAVPTPCYRYHFAVRLLESSHVFVP
jgi:hypothetical protein